MRLLQIQYERTKLFNQVVAVNINAVTKDFVKSCWKAQLYRPRGGPLEELSFRAGGSNRKATVTADTRGRGECDGGPSGRK